MKRLPYIIGGAVVIAGGIAWTSMRLGERKKLEAYLRESKRLKEAAYAEGWEDRKSEVEIYSISPAHNIMWSWFASQGLAGAEKVVEGQMIGEKRISSMWTGSASTEDYNLWLNHLAKKTVTLTNTITAKQGFIRIIQPFRLFQLPRDVEAADKVLGIDVKEVREAGREVLALAEAPWLPWNWDVFGDAFNPYQGYYVG